MNYVLVKPICSPEKWRFSRIRVQLIPDLLWLLSVKIGKKNASPLRARQLQICAKA